MALPGSLPHAASIASPTWLPRLKRPRLTREDGGARHLVSGTPSGSTCVAAFGLADCLVRFGDADKWCEFAWKNVCTSLQGLYSSGFLIVVIVNAGSGTTQTLNRQMLIPSICKEIGVPMRVFVAQGQDEYRKPAPGIWDTYLRDFNDGLAIDGRRSFFVGRLAGRPGDGSDIDRKFASNCGLRFLTPEEYFSNGPSVTGPMLGWDPRSYNHDLPLFSPTNTPIVPRPPGEFDPPRPVDVVLFAGPPGAGKSTTYRRFFAPKGYLRISRDHSHDHAACQKLLRDNLRSPNPSPCVIDALLPSVLERKEYIDATAGSTVPIRLRCFYFATPIEVARHNSLYRALTGVLNPSQHQRVIAPEIYASYQKQLVVPTTHEGFYEVKRINFSFDGTPEEKQRWQMRLLDVFADPDTTSW